MMTIPNLDELILSALREDIGDGDHSTLACIPSDYQGKAQMVAKAEGIICGIEVGKRVFELVDPNTQVTTLLKDGDKIKKGDLIMIVEGASGSILTAERTALNFMQRLSGIATQTNYMVGMLEGLHTRLLDTRKTTPGWRNMEKYAVAVGGASNHRIGLFDRIMIKDNHREMAGMEGPGGILRSVERARKAYPELEIEVEVDTLEELDEAIKSGCEYILLDNMTTEMMAEAVKRNNGRAKLEASGNITIERLPEIAATGVDFASSGALTHSVKSADISLDIKPLK